MGVSWNIYTLDICHFSWLRRKKKQSA